VELTIEDVAGRAGVDVAYVRRLVDLGALGPEGDGYREQDAHVTALLRMWEDAGLTAESILAGAESAGSLARPRIAERWRHRCTKIPVSRCRYHGSPFVLLRPIR
jgi:hypothetical protein